jgi:hypothetical protein
LIELAAKCGGTTFRRTRKVSELILKQRRGKSLHTINPFVGNAVASTKQGIKRISNKDGDRMMVVSENTGEIVAPAGFWQAQEVDKTQFVKLYVNGVRAFKDLTNAGTKVFEILYLEVQKNIGKDKIYMNFVNLDPDVTPMSEATFNRGMRELVEKEFIAATPIIGWYWLNPDYMWNGDRLAFVKEYRKAPSRPKDQEKDTQTLDLFEQINAPETALESVPVSLPAGVPSQ